MTPPGFPDVLGSTALEMRLHGIAAFLDLYAGRAVVCVDVWWEVSRGFASGVPRPPLRALPHTTHRACVLDLAALLAAALDSRNATAPPFQEAVLRLGVPPSAHEPQLELAVGVGDVFALPGFDAAGVRVPLDDVGALDGGALVVAVSLRDAVIATDVIVMEAVRIEA